MDCQKTKEPRRDAPGQQEEGTDRPLYNGQGHSQNSPKNDSLSRNSDARNTKKKTDGAHRPQGDGLYTQNAHQPWPSSSSSRASPRACFPSSRAIPIPLALGLGPRETNLLITANRYPPVTKSTLSELDLPCIMGNINLRMDANFDRDLHFKPDLDGEKGRKKRRDAREYWEAMASEISVYAFCQRVDRPQEHHNEGSSFEPRLPALFETLQDVLKTLVPERDHPNIMENLEVALLMQQIQKGVLDMVVIAKWLAGLLKTHCAPMRDEWADTMVRQISSGSQRQDAGEIVSGLRTLFAILEAMKLDVANHQIRAFRFLLIEDTIPFLQEYWRNKIERDGFQVESSLLWYQSIREHELRRMKNPTQTDGFWPLSLLFQGLTETLLDFHTPDAGFPDTFGFDSERLWQLRAGLQNAINLDICWYVFEMFVHNYRRYAPPSTQTEVTFRSRIGTLMEENEDYIRGSPQWLKNVRCISLEIARFVSTECCGDGTIMDEVIGPIEAHLEWHLLNERGHLFQYSQNSVREKLLEATFSTAKKYINMSPLAICESQRLPSHPPAEQQYDIERIATRLAHIGVLHWRVWAPLLYVRDSVPSTDESMFQPETEMAALISRLESKLAEHGARMAEEHSKKPAGWHRKTIHVPGPKIDAKNIISIDMGVRNMAFAVFQVRGTPTASVLDTFEERMNKKEGWEKEEEMRLCRERLRRERMALRVTKERKGEGEGEDPYAELREKKETIILRAWRHFSLPIDRGLTGPQFSRFLDGESLVSNGPAESSSHDDDVLGSAEDSDVETKPEAQGTESEEEVNTFSPWVYAAHANSILTQMFYRYQPTHILIERQRFRSGGGAAVQEWSLRVGVLEGMLWAVAHTLIGNKARDKNFHPPRVVAIDPGSVGRFWAPDADPETDSSLERDGNETKQKAKKSTTSREGKKLKIDLVGSWLQNDAFDISAMDCTPEWVDAYLAKWNKRSGRSQIVKAASESEAVVQRTESESSESPSDDTPEKTQKRALKKPNPLPEIPKLDDLADCLVQAVTWLEWERTKTRLFEEDTAYKQFIEEEAGRRRLIERRKTERRVSILDQAAEHLASRSRGRKNA
ncbi:T-complex protein 11-domain-containing protein [Aspergillus filifer]